MIIAFIAERKSFSFLNRNEIFFEREMFFTGGGGAEVNCRRKTSKTQFTIPSPLTSHIKPFSIHLSQRRLQFTIHSTHPDDGTLVDT